MIMFVLRVEKKETIKEGIDSIPKLEKEFKTQLPSDVIGSLLISMKQTGAAKKYSKKAWNKLTDLYYDFQTDEEEKGEE